MNNDIEVGQFLRQYQLFYHIKHADFEVIWLGQWGNAVISNDQK